jgi:hypothetical protein
MRSRRTEALFNGTNGTTVNGLITARAERMKAEIDDTPEEHLFQADEDEWAAALAARYAISEPVLRSDEWTMEDPQPLRTPSRPRTRVCAGESVHASGCPS